MSRPVLFVLDDDAGVVHAQTMPNTQTSSR